MPVKVNVRNWIFAYMLLLFPGRMSGACTLTINAFPYVQDFETGAAGWVSGGTSNDWAIGTPSKSAINAAGSGSNCWIIGGLTTSFYNFGERSWVESPCFNFSTLNHPYISLLVYWESEQRYDGANLQYSVNGGTTWINVGSVNEPTDCYTANWYNYASITNLSTLATVTNGWSGNHLPTSGSCQGGNGSGGWVEAKHCLSILAHQPQVNFRMTFGAGTTCNSFDGFAFDLVTIQEAPPPVTDFSFACVANNSFSFTDASTNCPETWTWNFGDGATSVSQNPTHLYAVSGTYNVTLVSGNSCSGTTTLSKSVTIISASTLSTPITCNGNANGMSIANANPAGTFSYSWNTSPAQVTQAATGLTAGTYMVTVTGTGVCPVTATATITEPPLLTLTSTSTPSVCGIPTGTASVQPLGGTPGYAYLWAPRGDNSQSVSGLLSGTYTVTVSDASGCTQTTSVTVGANGGPTVTASVTGNVSCNGGSDGSASAVIFSGITPFAVNWNPTGGTSLSASGLAAGSYTVTITDGGGCTTSQSVMIIEPPALAAITSVTPAHCNGSSDGAASVIASGGTLPYLYSWMPSSSTLTSISGLAAGVYMVTVIDAHACGLALNVNISSPPAIVLSSSVNPASCFGSNSGNASVIASGGASGFAYQWSPSGGTGSTTSSLGAGNYTVIVTDQNGCSNTASVTVTQPNAITLSLVATPASCNGVSDGVASVVASGGSGRGFTYQWTPTGGAGTNAIGLFAGTYSVMVIDTNGCTSTAQTIITQPSPISITASGLTTICIGQYTSITLSGNGGTPNYSFLWNNGLIGSTQSLNPLISTTYTVSMQDANGCQATPTVITITLHPPLSINTSSSILVCAGQSVVIFANASGGNGGPYTYSWNGGAFSGGSPTVNPVHDSTFTVTATDGCGTPATTGTVQVIVNPLPVVDFFPHRQEGCKPFTADFYNHVFTMPGSFYLWDFGDQSISTDSNPSHLYSKSGEYNVSLHVVSPLGCADSVLIPNAVHVFGFPTSGFGQSASTVTTFNPFVSFSDNSIGAVNWNWDFGDSTNVATEQNPMHQYTDTGTYSVRLIIESGAGCLDTAYGIVRVEYDFAIYLPNAFTPNEDGINDEFFVLGTGIKEFEMRILDRWGKEIFVSTDLNYRWNGTVQGKSTPCQNDVYDYIVTIHDFSEQEHIYTGRISLLK